MAIRPQTLVSFRAKFVEWKFGLNQVLVSLTLMRRCMSNRFLAPELFFNYIFNLHIFIYEITEVTYKS